MERQSDLNLVFKVVTVPTFFLTTMKTTEFKASEMPLLKTATKEVSVSSLCNDMGEVGLKTNKLTNFFFF